MISGCHKARESHAELLGQHNVPQERAADVLVEVLLEDAGEVLRDMQAGHGRAVLQRLSSDVMDRL